DEADIERVGKEVHRTVREQDVRSSGMETVDLVVVGDVDGVRSGVGRAVESVTFGDVFGGPVGPPRAAALAGRGLAASAEAERAAGVFGDDKGAAEAVRAYRKVQT